MQAVRRGAQQVQVQVEPWEVLKQEVLPAAVLLRSGRSLHVTIKVKEDFDWSENSGKFA